MKKTFLVLSAILFISPFCFAQETSAPVSQTVLESKTFVGKVGSVSLSDSIEGTRFEIAVENDQGQTMNFVITPGISITTSAGKIVAPKKIKEADRVTVEYTTTKLGINRALSITIEK
jgi:hypothetical protein